MESDHAYLDMSLALSQTMRRYGRDTTICTLIDSFGDCSLTIGRYPYMVPTDGIEPSTYCLQGSCSANWAESAYGVPSGIRTRDVALKGLWLDRLSMGTYGAKMRLINYLGWDKRFALLNNAFTAHRVNYFTNLNIWWVEKDSNLRNRSVAFTVRCRCHLAIYPKRKDRTYALSIIVIIGSP